MNKALKIFLIATMILLTGVCSVSAEDAEYKNIPWKYGEPIEIDTKAVIHKDRLMLPVRFISEVLDFAVEWDEVTKTVSINRERGTENE